MPNIGSKLEFQTWFKAKAFAFPGFSLHQVRSQQLNKESVITSFFPYLGSSSAPIEHLPNFCFWSFQVCRFWKEREEGEKKEESFWLGKYTQSDPALSCTVCHWLILQWVSIIYRSEDSHAPSKGNLSSAVH